MTTELLGFDDLNYNSLYAQMGRGRTERIVAQVLAGFADTLSRFAMDVVLYLSQNFAFISFPESITTGSSIMPHKKNPDVFELIRGKCGRLMGHLTGFMTTMKGLPSGYNKDLQEDKEPLFDAVDTLMLILPALEAVLKGVNFHPETIMEKLSPTLKTERIVRYLIAKGLPFREAYAGAGKLVRESESRDVELQDLPLEVMQSVLGIIEADLQEVLVAGWAIPEDGVLGGSNRGSLASQISSLREWLANRL